MKKEFEFIKNSIVDSIKDNFGIDVSEEISFDEVALEINESITVETSFDYDGKEARVSLCKVWLDTKDRNVYQLSMFFGSECSNVKEANKMMDKYDKTEIAKVIEIEDCVEAEDDVIHLTSVLFDGNGDNLKDGLDKVFRLMGDEDKSKPLKELLQYFE